MVVWGWLFLVLRLFGVLRCRIFVGGFGVLLWMLSLGWVFGFGVIVGFGFVLIECGLGVGFVVCVWFCGFVWGGCV